MSSAQCDSVGLDLPPQTYLSRKIPLCAQPAFYLPRASVIGIGHSAYYMHRHRRRTSTVITLNRMATDRNDNTPDYVKTCGVLLLFRGFFLVIGIFISASIQSDGGASTLLHFVALLILVAECAALARFSAHISSPWPAPPDAARTGWFWAVVHFALWLASLGVWLGCLGVGWSEDKWRNERFIYLPDMFGVTIIVGALAVAPVVRHVRCWRWCGLRRHLGLGRRGNGFAVVDDEAITLVPCASDDGDDESAPLAVAADAAAAAGAGTCADGEDGSVGKASFESAA